MVAFGDFRSDSLDYANRWRSPHAEPPIHSDRKSCSTRCEISSPVATPSITRIAGGAHTRSRPVTAIVSRVQLDARTPPQFIPTPSAKELGITFRTSIGIAYVTTIRNGNPETVDKALVSRNSVPGPKFPPERVY
ncbi:hypothetical protein Taro_009450 [Colocasia esculenta]|uniref:Uncharacterized protein n=1 Tax=Colocasia esculenta TaxID=4460 RepID=A0A843U6H8_COLES|nr:hypothetical protein [Colocasia esculenta]